LFHARGPAAVKDRSPSDDIVRGTATELDAADMDRGSPSQLGKGMERGSVPFRKFLLEFLSENAVIGCNFMHSFQYRPICTHNKETEEI